jgi:hypothetical protein
VRRRGRGQVGAVVEAIDTRCQPLAPVQQKPPVVIGQGLGVVEAPVRVADRIPRR